MPKSQFDFDPSKSEEMTDGTMIQWADSTYHSEKGQKLKDKIGKYGYDIDIICFRHLVPSFNLSALVIGNSAKRLP